MDKIEVTQDGITVIGECNPDHEDVYFVDDHDDKPIEAIAYWIMATYPGN